MSFENRPDPDALLHALNEEAREKDRGHLRIVLGMSAGVGKTYAMLRAAHQKMSEDVDVVVGIVETHGRPETAALAEGLSYIPKKKIDYRGTIVEEMDLDEILQQHPKLIIIYLIINNRKGTFKHKK